MNQVSFQQNAITFCDERRGLVSISDYKSPVVCPKPRRVGILANNPIRPLRWPVSWAELLDIILMKEGHGTDYSTNQVASSPPPFFCGSPPTRVGNPLIQDARFGDEKLAPISPLSIPSPSGLSSPSSSACKGGCVRMKFGLKPAEVRVEGFDCLNRDRQNSSIPAVA
ncbi:Autophagy-related [Salix suchowensis]|nr:Autophagy-related [Salix suchowensis]